MNKKSEKLSVNIQNIFHNLLKKRFPPLGMKGENLAVKFLKKQGYEILDRNFRLRGGEIDIIAKDREEIVFVEVKTRTSCNSEFIMASVGKEKQRKISKTALYYISKNKYTDYTGRFDVVFVIGDKGNPKIEHFKDAFPLCENI